jgi:hypothetical protein
MRIQRVITKQGHPVPKVAGNPKGPFPPELYQKAELITEYYSVDDENPIGGTAQNNFTEPRLFKCRFCDEIMYEHKTGNHMCEELEDGEDA